jgi:hypothetical protein
MPLDSPYIYAHNTTSTAAQFWNSPNLHRSRDYGATWQTVGGVTTGQRWHGVATDYSGSFWITLIGLFYTGNNGAIFYSGP